MIVFNIMKVVYPEYILLVSIMNTIVNILIKFDILIILIQNI